MRIAVLVLAATLSLATAFAPSLVSQSGNASQQGRKLLDQAIAALGGDAFLHLKTERLEGRIYGFRHERLSGFATVVEFVRFPGQERVEYGKKKEEIDIVSGDKIWSIDFHGVHPTPAEEAQAQLERRMMGAFHILRYRLNEPGSTVEYAGRERVDNREMDVVNFIDSDNRTVAIALDRSSHLPAQAVWNHRDPKTHDRIEEIESLSNYLTVQGVAAPRHLMRTRDGAKIFEAFIQAIQYNIELSDSLFVPKAP